MIAIGGFLPFSTIDYPDKLSAVVFCQGCPWRRRYCYNTNLTNFKSVTKYDWDSVYKFLKTRRALLDAIVFSGGEPTAQKGLLEVVKQVKSLGFNVGLHTGGSYTQTLSKLLQYIDWVGLDIKTLFSEYQNITRTKNSGMSVKKSLDLLLENKIEFECRTTIHYKLHDSTLLENLTDELCRAGVENYSVQICRMDNVMDSSLEDNYFSSIFSNKLNEQIKHKFKKFTLRN